jgi:hypothetical protein
MSKGEKYRIATSTVAITSSKEGRAIVTIPKKAIVEVVSSVLNDERLVEILYQDRPLVMFTRDLRERGQYLAGGKDRRMAI